MLDMREVESAPVWLLNKISETHDNIVKIATVLWDIWLVRNKKVWENENITPNLTVDMSSKQLLYWQLAIQKKQVSNAVAGRFPSGCFLRWDG